MLIGVPLGLLAGYRGGWLSETIMRITDVVLAIPQLVLALASRSSCRRRSKAPCWLCR
jgi:peptide/nickel transport system permease protein